MVLQIQLRAGLTDGAHRGEQLSEMLDYNPWVSLTMASAAEGDGANNPGGVGPNLTPANWKLSRQVKLAYLLLKAKIRAII